MTDQIATTHPLSFLRPPEAVAAELIAQQGLGIGSPLYNRAKQRAAERGLDLKQLLEADAERLAAYPTAACLTAGEITAHLSGRPLASTDRMVHADECEFCTRVLQAARPTAEQRERFLDELGSLAARAAVHASQPVER